MSMTEVYQPVIIKELLLKNGKCSKTDLAVALARYDLSVLDYYKKIVMRWPKKILSKHGIITYEREGEVFRLGAELVDSGNVEHEVGICEQKIEEWIDKKRNREKTPQANESLRYKILKRSHGKCELCGIDSSLRPIDIDHIVPQSTQNKNGKVKKDGNWIDVHSEENLQALCFKCNRAKRASDETDFRRTKKLVRDKIPKIIKNEGRTPIIKELQGKSLMHALKEKLVEEHGEYIAETDKAKSVSELADMVEVIFSLAKCKGFSKEQLLKIAEDKRLKNGGFDKGFYYEGDETNKAIK